MGKRLANWIKTRRAARLGRSIAVSSFTVFLLGFGLSYWFFHFYTTTLMVGCEYPLAWVVGWENFWSPFQVIGFAIALCITIWLLRLISLRHLNRAETAFQFIFILGLVAAFVAQKAYFFPYGTPSAAQVERAVTLSWGQRMRLIEEREREIDIRDYWEYDYPPPPFARKPDLKTYVGYAYMSPEEIFLTKDSPTYADFKRLYLCNQNHRNVEAQYQRDLEIWESYWEGFRKNYPSTFPPYRR